jgi:hypothetical protein
MEELKEIVKTICMVVYLLEEIFTIVHKFRKLMGKNVLPNPHISELVEGFTPLISSLPNAPIYWLLNPKAVVFSKLKFF